MHLELDLLRFALFGGILCVKVSPSDWKLPVISTSVVLLNLFTEYGPKMIQSISCNVRGMLGVVPYYFVYFVFLSLTKVKSQNEQLQNDFLHKSNEDKKTV